MSKNQDSRQVEHRSELKRLSDQAKPSLKELLPQINAELTPVFELRASDTPDLTLNIGPGAITNTDTGLKRSFSPIDSQYFEYNGGTIVFPAANGGNIVIANGIDSILVMADDTYMTVLAQINSIGEVSVAQGIAQAVEADTLLAANFPVPNSGELPIGYVTLHNDAGVIQVIENEKIVQFESGGGGSGSGDAVGFESEMDDLLSDGFYEWYAPVVFKRDKEDFVDGSSTGDFKNADGTYQLEIGEILVTTNLFDIVFVADNIKSLQKQLVVDYFDDASRDDGATYELSIDGGVTYETVTMERQAGTTRYTGDLLLSNNATYNDLRLRITASEAETKLFNIAVFYNEMPNDLVEGIAVDQATIDTVNALDSREWNQADFFEEFDESVVSPGAVVSGSCTGLTNLKFTGHRVGKTYHIGFSFNFNATDTNNFGTAQVDIPTLFSFLAGVVIDDVMGSFGTNMNSGTNGRNFMNGYASKIDGDTIQFNFNGDDAGQASRFAAGTLMLKVI